MDYLCVMLIVVGFKKAFCYHCTMESFEVTCTGLSNSELSQNISVTLNKPDIVTLNLTNGTLPTISETTFHDFTNLETLYVTNCRVSSIETNSFSQFENLRNLYLGHNNLTNFNVLSLSQQNQLILLDLSYNQLKNLSGFNLSHFSKLNVLNLANNFISYLPRNVVQKLEEQNNFYLIVDNNPWDCNNSNWVDYLTPRLRQGFCPDKTDDNTVETASESNNPVLETTISSFLEPFVDEEPRNIENSTGGDNKTYENTVETSSESNNQVLETTLSSFLHTFVDEEHRNIENSTDDDNKTYENTVETSSESNNQVLETTISSFFQPFVDEEPSHIANSTDDDQNTVETTSENNNQALGTTLSSQDDNNSFLQQFVADPSDTDNENARKIRKKYCPKPTCSKCGVYYCISWFAGGIWLGIIFGNLPKIIAMLWSKQKSYADESTQCEQHISDQYMISGYHLDFKHGKIQPKTSTA